MQYGPPPWRQFGVNGVIISGIIGQYIEMGLGIPFTGGVCPSMICTGEKKKKCRGTIRILSGIQCVIAVSVTEGTQGVRLGGRKQTESTRD